MIIFQTLTCKGKTVKGFWERRVKVEGCYMYEKGENIEAYYKAIGKTDLIKNFKDYKVHMYVNGKNIRMSEYIGDYGRICNDMELDMEVPFRVAGDRKGSNFGILNWESLNFKESKKTDYGSDNNFKFPKLFKTFLVQPWALF